MSEADQSRERHRVFFALWPDDATRAAISRATRDAVRASAGRPIAKDRMHLTVAFLGELSGAGLAVARAVPPSVVNGAVGAFELTRDALGGRPETTILWLAPSDPPHALGELEGGLWDALVERGFRGEDRTYRPHITLARRSRALDAVVEPVRWAVSELALVESFPDGRNVHYEVLERWPL